MNWIRLPEGRGQWRSLVLAVLDLRVQFLSSLARYYLISEACYSDCCFRGFSQSFM
jgi:hypothetical protein